jgi:hypothetical protein
VIDRLMGVLMTAFGVLLLGGVVFRWPWLHAGAKYRRLAAVSPWLPAAIYGSVGLFFIVAGVLHLVGRWPEGGRFWAPR